MFKNSEKKEWMVARIIIAVVAIVFTLYGFFIPQECDIDKIYLWCNLHPLSVGDVFGLTLFYGGLFMTTGLWQKWFTLWEEEHTTKWNLIIFGVMALGIILIWNT